MLSLFGKRGKKSEEQTRAFLRRHSQRLKDGQDVAARNDRPPEYQTVAPTVVSIPASAIEEPKPEVIDAEEPPPPPQPQQAAEKPRTPVGTPKPKKKTSRFKEPEHDGQNGHAQPQPDDQRQPDNVDGGGGGVHPIQAVTPPNSTNATPIILDHPPKPVHERVLAVIIHRTDRIKSKTYIVHPMVKVHLINATTGEYARKSQRQRAVAYVNETTAAPAVDYVLPLMTKPSDFRAQDAPSPVWEELLLFNDDFEHFIDPNNHLILMFEVLDFKSMSTAKRDATASPQAPTGLPPGESGGVDDRAGGWHRIAWAFLKIVSSNGSLNTGTNLRLQLFKAPAITKLRDERQAEVYHWWKYVPKVKFAGTLYVTVKPVDSPRNVPSATRSMYAVQKESILGGGMQNQHPSSVSLHEDGTPKTGGVEADEEGGKTPDEPQFAWSRLAGQPCKVPNKLMLTLPCGRGGCFRLKFSANGRHLAGAGAEIQTNKFPIYVYTFPGGKYSGILYGHLQLVYELSWNASDLLLSASADCTVRLWSVSQMRCSSILTHPTFVYCARFHPHNDNLVFTGAFDKHIRLWTVKDEHGKPRVIQEFEPHSNYVNCLCLTADSKFLYSGDGAGAIRIWAAADESGASWMFLKEIKEDRLLGKPINAVEIHPDQKRLFIQSRDGSVRALELRSLAFRAHYRGLHNADTHRGDLTPCGGLFFAGDSEGRVLVWHVQSGIIYAQYDRLSTTQYPVPCVSYHPFDHWVAFGVYGSRQPILIYKHDSSVPELHKEEPQEKPSEKKEGRAFDPDYSLAKLLEEHRLLTKIELPAGKWSAGTNRKQPTMNSRSPSSSNIRAEGGIDPSKRTQQIVDSAAGTSKRVTFDDAVQSGTPIQSRRAQFAQNESVQSSLREIPIVQNQTAEETSDEHLEASTDLSAINQATPKMPISRTAPPSSQTQPIAAVLKTSMSSASIHKQAAATIVETVAVSTKQILGRVRAKFNYKAQNDDEISFQKGDIINVVKKDEPWWVGYVVPETIGYFPANYVGEMEMANQ